MGRGSKVPDICSARDALPTGGTSHNRHADYGMPAGIRIAPARHATSIGKDRNDACAAARPVGSAGRKDGIYAYYRMPYEERRRAGAPPQ